MKHVKPRVSVATGLTGAAIVLVEEAALGLLKPFLPAWLQVSDSLLLTLAVAGIGAALLLLWRVANVASKALTDYRDSARKAHDYAAQFAALDKIHSQTKATLESIERHQAELTRLYGETSRKYDEAIAKLDRRETERERSLAELRQANETDIAAAADRAGVALERRMILKRDHTKLGLEGKISSLHQSLLQEVHQLRRDVHQLKESCRG